MKATAKDDVIMLAKGKITEIAARLCSLLAKRGEITLASANRDMCGATTAEVFIAIGWLYREGTVDLVEDGTRVLSIRLAPQEAKED